MKYFGLILVILTFSFAINAQDMKNINVDAADYYSQIPDYPDQYTSTNIAARMVDGLGFRYYWATRGLRNEDLTFSPNDDARTTSQTLDHIYTLTLIVRNSVTGGSNSKNENSEAWSFEKKRAKTLENISEVSKRLKASSEEDLSNYIAVFEQGERITKYPFWNMINGPIADAIWHIGQVVSFRRSSGNPISPGVSMLNGTYSRK
ncbi:MAG: hypothetical protein OEX22_04815 [Cyclobacteriaceae bacterium]|nr:hypothetical protein [Cyclobacteriaceae bacterium]